MRSFIVVSRSLFLRKWDRCFIVKYLPYFSSKDHLVTYFGTIGSVRSIHLIHEEEGTYTRTALVKMESPELAKRIIKQKYHFFEGKRIKVMKFRGMPKHISTLVNGKYEVTFRNVFASGLSVPENRENNDLLAETAYKRLEDAFHHLKYTKIRILVRRNEDYYNGNARVTFLDGKNEDEILRLANEKFEGCTVTTKMINDSKDEG